MHDKHVFVATHPRSCSTAFERVFMTCRDTLSCVHEPFGEAWYYGPERLSPRFEHDEAARLKSGYANLTYKDVFDAMDQQAEQEGKRLFIKDMAQYFMTPTDSNPWNVAPSLVEYRRGVGTTNGDVLTNGVHHKTHMENPSVVPKSVWEKYHVTFLIRHPRSAIPSYFRCTIPPLCEMTGFKTFDPTEAGYRELRLLFDYLRSADCIGPQLAGESSSDSGRTKVEICVVDADDLLDNPYGIIEAYCKSIGVEYSPKMLKWDDEQTRETAKEAFEKWKGFHEDALDSKELKPRTSKKAPKSDDEIMADWTTKFGAESAQVIMETVKDNIEDYEYLKQFAIKV